MDTAAIVVIGNEVLSGKVKDLNSPFLVSELRDLGVAVKRISTSVPQRAPATRIVESVRSVERWSVGETCLPGQRRHAAVLPPRLY